MSKFVEQLRLAEKAAEDIYFAKVNRELIESIRKQMQVEEDSVQASYESTSEARAECVDCVFSLPLDRANSDDELIFCIHPHKGRIANWCERMVKAKDKPCEDFERQSNNRGPNKPENADLHRGGGRSD